MKTKIPNRFRQILALASPPPSISLGHFQVPRCGVAAATLLLSASAMTAQVSTAWFQPNIPGAVSGVTKYRVIFSTRAVVGGTYGGGINATPGTTPTIAGFDSQVQTFATSSAAISFGLPQYTDGTTDGNLGGTALTWACLGSTNDGKTAVQNVATSLSDWSDNQYVYNTGGAQVTNPSITLFGSVHLAGAAFAEDGYDNYQANSGYRVNTGGQFFQAGTLGNAAEVGRTNPTAVATNGWFYQNNFGPGACGLYALSGLITWYNTSPTLPSPGITLSTVNPLRLMVATTGTITGEVTNSVTATGSYNNAQLSDLSGQASNGLGISGWNPAGPFTVGIGGSQPFTATLAAGWNPNGQYGNGFVKTYTVKVDDGAGNIATTSQIVNCLDNRKISADPFAVRVHAGFTSPVTLPVKLTGNNWGDNEATLPTVAAATYTTPDTLVSVTGVAGTFSQGLTTQTVNVTLNPGASSGVLNLALANGVGANIVRPEGLVGESINGVNFYDGTGNVSIPSDHLDLTYTVYSGQGIWNVDAGGDWSAFSNWTVDGGVPGIDGALSANDTATFGDALFFESATVTLDVSPRLKALTFDNLDVSYELAGPGTLTLDGGTGPVTIAVTGSHVISATVAVPASAGIRKTGPGTLTLSGANSYSGNTAVEDGVLSLTAPNLADSSTLTIGTVAASPAVLNLPNEGTDIVASLVIDGVAQAADLYDSSNSGGAITGLGKIRVNGAASPYATWIAGASGYFPGVTDTLIVGPTADPDKDGKQNFLEFALNSKPNDGGSGGKVFVKLATVGSVPNVLTLTTAVRASAAAFAPAGPGGNNKMAVDAADSLTYLIEAANNLADWGAPVVTEVTLDAAAIQTGLPSLDTGWVYKTFRTDGDTAADPADFIRVKIISQ